LPADGPKAAPDGRFERIGGFGADSAQLECEAASPDRAYFPPSTSLAIVASCMFDVPS
jgi:hypothetical protein